MTNINLINHPIHNSDLKLDILTDLNNISNCSVNQINSIPNINMFNKNNKQSENKKPQGVNKIPRIFSAKK